MFNSLRVEGTNLPEANLTYSFFNYAALVRVKLDRFEMNFFRLHEIGGEVANRAFVDAWRAMEKVVPGIRLAEHSVTATAFLAFPQSSLSEVALKFIQPPESFAGAVSGMAFYLPNKSPRRATSVVLDRPADGSDGAFFKLTTIFDAAQIRYDAVATATDSLLKECLGALGLDLEES